MLKFPVFLYAFASLFLTSCTLGKLMIHLRPNIDDHQKVFVCDTILASPLAGNFKFDRTDQSVDLPPLVQWVNQAQRLEAVDNQDFLNKTKTTALIIIRNDSIIYENYLNKGDKDRTQIVFSVTKAMTATLVAIAIQEGHMHLEQSVSDFIPAYQNDARRHIKIKHLLGMVSGLNWNDYKDLAKIGQLYYCNNHQQFIISKTAVRVAPDQEFRYKSISTQILSQCLSKATHQAYADYMQSKIWNFIGHEQPIYVTLDSKKNRIARSFGGMAMSARDMARFGKLLLNDGIWNGKRLVPAWFVQQLRSRDLNKWIGYRHYFWRNGYEAVNFEKNEQFWAAGFSGQYIFVSPQENIIIIRTGLREKNRWSVILGRLSAILSGKGNDLTDAALDFGAQFEGKYRNKKGQEMQFDRVEGLDKYGRRNWNWRYNTEDFESNKTRKVLYQFDGVSMGIKTQGEQTRMYFKVIEGQVNGMYFNSWPSTQFDYFEKIN